MIPGVFMPAVEKGVRQALAEGGIAGYPVEDLRVIVYDGKSHPVDGKEVAFITAGKKAVLDAISKAGAGRAGADRQHRDHGAGEFRRRPDLGSVRPARPGHRHRAARHRTPWRSPAQVPLAELSDYQSRLRSMTGGHGAYTIEFSHYAPVPPQTQQQLMSQFKRTADED